MSAPEPQTWGWGDPEPKPVPGWEFETHWELGGQHYTRVYTRPVIEHNEPIGRDTVAVPIELAHQLDGLLSLLRHRYVVNVPGDLLWQVDSAIGQLRRLIEEIDAPQPDGPVYAETIHPCPHCPCTYSTECCYCDGSRTPLEDS